MYKIHRIHKTPVKEGFVKKSLLTYDRIGYIITLYRSRSIPEHCQMTGKCLMGMIFPSIIK